MRKSLITALLVMLVFVLVALPVQATSFYCKYAQYHPGYAIACFWEIMFDFWDPLDWGDGDADNYVGAPLILKEAPALCFIVEYPTTFTAIPRAG